MALNKRPLLLILALASGGTAGLLAIRYLGQESGPAPVEAVAERQLVVAAADLPLGTVLNEQHVRLVKWWGDALPAGFASSVADVMGRGVITPLVANEPLLAAKLADKEAGGGLPIVIPEGMRAVSVKVDEVVGVAGFVLPGTRVDVLVTLRPSRSESEPATRVILQNVRTLTAGQQIQRDAEGKPQSVTVVTLLVTPEEAERLTLGAVEGRIQLALRNTLDGAEVQTTGTDTGRLLAGGEPPRPAPRRVQPAAPAPPATTVIEIYRGGTRSETTLKGTGE
jgi:pilus assembly protein CpaB